MIPDSLVNVCMASAGLIGFAAGACWNFAARHTLRCELRQERIRSARLEVRVERQHAEILKLRRVLATSVKHPSAPHMQIPVRGSDDEALAAARHSR